MSDLDPRSKVVREAHRRYERAKDWEAPFRPRFLDDIKFANADAYNHWQWPDAVRKQRTEANTPHLTINKTRQHILLVINDAKQNKPAIKVSPVGNQATFEAAQVWASIIRRIEYQSNASTVYDTATTFQVQGGIGYWRVVTDYCDPESFDQDIYLRRIPDPLKVYLDPDAKEADKSDCKYGFIFDEIEKDDFEFEYPEYKDSGGQSALGIDNDWVTKDKIRVCEYYRIVEKKDQIFLVPQEDGSRQKFKGSDLPPSIRAELRARPDVRKRDTITKQCEWKFIVGNEVVDEKDWPGKYIPIVAVIGEETVIEGKLDRKGHTRALLDPQRMYNYWSSAAVEYGALQTKTPWLAASEAIEGYESYWRTMNTVNHSYIPYNAFGDDGQPIPPPQRQEPPAAAPVALQGMQVAAQELMMASGQYEAAQGQQDNSRTGVAINERQRQGDKATYHYIDQLAISIRFTGKILLDLIPKIYDTERTIMIMQEDGASLELKIDPQQQQAFQAEQNERLETINRVLNPNVGQYEVEADVGPGYGTKRQEAFEAYKLILTQAPDLAAIIADILFKAADFPMADEAAARLRRMVPPQALGTGPGPAEQQLQQQVEQMGNTISQLNDLLVDAQLKLRGKAEDKTIDAYNALTKRLKVLGDSDMDEKRFKGEVMELIHDMRLEHMDRSLDAVRTATEAQLASAKMKEPASAGA